MDTPSTEITYTRSGEHIARVTLNRPQSRNAYNAAMVRHLDDIIKKTEEDRDIWVVILTGSGDKSFCAGADLKEAFENGGTKLLSKHGGYQPLQNIKRQKLWIAALNGDAFGGGFELALHCDFILSSAGIKLGLPEVRHSLLPLGGGIQKLVSSLPINLAREIILSGEAIDAERAFQLGIINHIVSRESLMASAEHFATRLCRNAPLAVRACNTLISEVNQCSTSEWLQRCEEELSAIRSSQDYSDNQDAFIKKKIPLWHAK
ncbi:enoyl-CoA hydratase/isomerase family protein [Pectobacterium sp. A5351]|uniref:enoyl-CoA hydratase/isomerase family protein n=1 Tax=Pectobacterium sp. A5351 TaxID=2914983 RepID=UPI00232D5960|nr:enoyl-CoA hydratase/isomerase family protein [Pectobacterium sp. A5351]WCG82656.1 enoyl-CoA hydratase/isomerase family protein [Pectobacterium sp. A5351]